MDCLVLDFATCPAFEEKTRIIVCNRKPVGFVMYDGWFGKFLNQVYKELDNKGIDWNECTFIDEDMFYSDMLLYVDYDWYGRSVRSHEVSQDDEAFY